MIFLSPFTESFLAAVRYYKAVDSKFAVRFIEAVDQAQDKIAKFPKIGRSTGQYREFPLRGFPYNYCYYEDLDGELVAMVLCHHKQKEPRIR